MKFNVDYFLFLTIICTALIVVIKIITPIMDRYCKRTWRYFAWLLIGMRLLLPLDFSIDNHNINLNKQNLNAKEVIWMWENRGANPIDKVQQSQGNNYETINKKANISNESLQKKVEQKKQGENYKLNLQGEEIKETKDTEEQSTNTKVQNNIVINYNDNNANKYTTNFKSLNLYEKIVIVWLGIGIVIVLYNMLAYMFMQRNMRKNSEIVDDEKIIAQLSSIKNQLDLQRRILVRKNNKITSPMVMGWIHPVLYLTHDDYNEEEMYYILAHELTHVKNLHVFIKFIFVIINSIYWFNPFVYLMRKEVAKDIEFLCDAGVSKILDNGSVKNYCEVILRCVIMKSQPQVLFSSSFGGIKKQVKERLIHIMDSNKKKNGIIVSAILCIALVGFTLMVSYKSQDNNVIGKKDGAVFSEDMTTKEQTKEELTMLQGRVVNVMNNAIVGDCKKSSPQDSQEFLKQVPFKEDFNFTTYESKWIVEGTNKPVRYAIGICNKEESPLDGVFCNYDFLPGEKEGAVDSTTLWKYENHQYKEIYNLKSIDRCATLCNGQMVIVLQCHQDNRIYLPFERLHYGTTEIAYLEDTIKRNVKVMQPTNEDYIQVTKLSTTSELFGNSEYILLNKEEKNKILEEINKNNHVSYKDHTTSVSNNVVLKIDEKYYECENSIIGPYFMNLIKERCNFYDYNLDDLKNIKTAKLQKYYINSLQAYDLESKTVLLKEQTIDNTEQIKSIVDALRAKNDDEGKNTLCEDANVSILTLTRDDGMVIRTKLPMVSAGYEKGSIVMENGYIYEITQDNLKKIYTSFGDIVRRKSMADIKLNEKSIDTSNKLYLGMPSYDIEKFAFEINNDFDIDSQGGVHHGNDVVYEFGNITLIGDGRDNKKAIYSIEVKDSSISTTSGMKVGDNKEKMEKLYGKNYKTEKLKVNGDDITKYIYKFKNNDFHVWLKNGSVESWCIIKDSWKEEIEQGPSYFGQWKLTKSSQPMEYDEESTEYVFATGIYKAGNMKMYPMNEVKYTENHMKNSEVKNKYGINLNEYGIKGEDILVVEVAAKYFGNLGTIIMDSNNKDAAVLVKNEMHIPLDRYIHLERIR